MKRSSHLSSNGFAVSLFVLAAAAAVASQPAVLASSLDALRIDGKVSDVLWTRRADIFTLQVLMPRPPRGDDLPKIDAWLLRPDGSRMAAIGRWDTPKCGNNPRCVGSEVEYSFSLAAGKQAAIVVLTVDGATHTDRLEPLGD